jgi:hypothetical protein
MGTLRTSLVVLLSLLSFSLAGCVGDRVSADRVYTLYRNSSTDENARYHVATFDADEEESYNRGNCEVAQQLYQAQPGIKTRFFCEKGYFRK